MPRKIFICYRRDDSGIAGRIGDSLGVEFGRDEVFLDTDKLTLGRRFDSELLRTLNESDVFIAVIGTQWLQTLQERQQSGQVDYVVEEIKEALRLNLSVIPLLVDGAVLPDESLLPVEISSAMRWHGHNVRHESFRRDSDELIAAIHHIRGSDRPAGDSTVPKVFTGVVLLFAVTGAGWWLWQAGPDESAKINLSNQGAIATPSTIETTGGSDSNGELDAVSQGDTENLSDNIVSTLTGSDEVANQSVEQTVADNKFAEQLNQDASDFQPTESAVVPDLLEREPATSNPALIVAPVEAEKQSDTIITGDSNRLVVMEEPVVKTSTVHEVFEEENNNNVDLTPVVGSQMPQPADEASDDTQWDGDFSIFPDNSFELCGYTSFTALVSGGGKELVIKSSDRGIPGQTFRGLQWRVEPNTSVELFKGCRVLLSYENISGTERIRVKEKGE